jgi:hydrogenase expression/formation protein HypE
VVLVSGTLGDHGVAVLSQRESLAFDSEVVSDTAALHTLVAALLAAVPEGAVRTLRDPTRGGLATTLNEIARQSGVGMMLDEALLPIQPQVDAACELLGLDPLYLANEGKLIAIVAPEVADTAWPRCAPIRWGRRPPASARCRKTPPLRADAHALWRAAGGGLVVGEPLPRIC